MADPPPQSSPVHGHLDASGEREVVFCHLCEHEWYRDAGGLICPVCEGEVTEIVAPESDPRPIHDSRPQTPPEFRSLRTHNPWQGQQDSDSDPEEADIEEHITHHGPGNMVFTRTIRSSARPDGQRGRNPQAVNDPGALMQDFQSMVNTIMGPANIRTGRPGRSGQADLYAGAFNDDVGGRPRPTIAGGRYTYTAILRAQDPNNQANPVLGDLNAILGGMFGQMGPVPANGGQNGPGALPIPLQTLLATLLNPANARHGDAVYSQEALDQIISRLMEQHPTSNAPGPASPDAIAALPKKKLESKDLEPEGKGECSVCMDDVTVGDEVVVLPCKHWFHENCASAWLGEHNTCPICRNGIGGGNFPAPNNAQPSQPEGERAVPLDLEFRHRAAEEARREQEAMTNGDSIAEERALLQHREQLRQQRRERLDAIRGTAGLAPEDADDVYIPGSFERRAADMYGQQSSRGQDSETQQERDPRRNSQSNNSGGAMSWFRDRWGGAGRRTG